MIFRNPIYMKKCKTCKSEQPFENFYNKHSQCKKCFSIKNKAYRLANPEKVRAIEIRYLNKNRPERLKRMRDYYARLRNELFEAYGNKCKCCGEDRKEFFAVDHIHGGGNLEKRNLGTRPLYRKIKAEGYPKDKYQILCHNCNMSLGFYGYCPHNPSVKRKVVFGGKTN